MSKTPPTPSSSVDDLDVWLDKFLCSEAGTEVVRFATSGRVFRAAHLLCRNYDRWLAARVPESVEECATAIRDVCGWGSAGKQAEIVALITSLLSGAVEAERERCARLCEEWAEEWASDPLVVGSKEATALRIIAAAIRVGSETT